ncbi:MAG: alpha-amylase family glycosyl hydrolase [Candidatus Methylacidiphilales bacterium]|nr:alpha-amylase family glycosyl hydrolase [Candidatus Methylacidiphilales bacterium]
MKNCRPFGALLVACGLLFTCFAPRPARAEAMLQYFNTSWAEITRKMPELAEAGYTSLWLPPPTKGSGGLSVGYDLWDPFDLGSKDQRGSVRTRYGTEAELLHLMEVAHRFGIRVYFDNIMNHRAFDVPGYNEQTAIDIYPGMVPEDFHLRVTEDGFYRKWDNTRDWGSAWQVQNLGLADLIDIAHETPNANFGRTEGSTHPKYSFVRHPNNPEYYDRLPNGTYVGFGTNNGITTGIIAANPDFYKEDVGAYLIRNARWLMDRTRADGLRLDAVKHVPDYFFGQQSGANKDSSDAGYLGGVQRQFNITRGFSDSNHRDSVFDTEKGRDDAMVFGEHLGSPPGYSGYWDAGMRLVDNDLRSKLNGVLGSPWGTLLGLDSAGGGGFSPSLGVMHANSHDSDYSAMRQLQHAMYYTREGLGLVYTDGYHQAETLGESGGAFPRHANTAFLGQFADPRIPNLLKIHQDFSRGFQVGRWGDNDFLAYERRDNRNPDGSTRVGNAADEITMVVMLNDNTAAGQSRAFSHSFPAGAYLYQYATGPNGSNQTGFYKFGSELSSVIVPPGGYFIFGYRTPELSTLWPESAITLYQNGVEVPRITVKREDGPDGDESFNPLGLSNRGYAPGETPEPFTYQTTVPVVKSGSALTILARADGSAENIMLKLDGGVDLNGTVPPGITDPAKRDNPPAVRTDTWLGYEQPTFVDRQHPEKFAAVDTARSQIGSPGAETYSKVIGSGNFTINNGPAGANNYSTESGRQAAWIYHDPAQTVGGANGTTGVGDAQYSEGATTLTLWAKSNSVGAGFKMFVYYTVDGSYPEGAGGIGRGTTQVAEMLFQHNQNPDDWWNTVDIPKPAPGSTFRYKIGLFKNGDGIQASWWPADAASVAYKKKMLTTFRVNNFDPATVQHHLHNDYNSLTTGLKEGFHVLRAKALLNRNPSTQAALYQTFTQTFYYDAVTPGGEVAFPQNNGDTVGGSSYEVVIRTDPTVEEVWYNIDDSEAGNNDSATAKLNGNGDGFEPFTDENQNGVRDSGEAFTDLNGNGAYDDDIPMAWARATEVTANPAVTSTYAKEWRLRYTNIPSDNSATLTLRLLEASSSRNFTLNATVGHYTELQRTVQTRGPLERINIAWPQNDGDRVDDNYTMKVYFSKSLANGLSETDLKNRFTFSANGVAQSRSGFAINYGSFGPGGAYHELSVPLPNLYNDVADFLHELKVEYRFPDPDNRVLQAFRLVVANPSTKPYVLITQPAELGSDGKPVEIVLPDGPGADSTISTVRVTTGMTVTGLSLSYLTGNITLVNEPFTDSNSNGKYDDGEPFTDSNSNNVWEGTTVETVGTTKYWDFRWLITAPGTYNLVAATTSTTNGQSASDTRSALVVLRESVATDVDEYNDDDDDGLIDIDETNPKELPTGNAETWTNGDVHVYYAYGRTLPNTPDSDGDGLPDGLEVGWRTAASATTNATMDTNGDGFPNFIGDMDPPLYAVLENNGYVPGVGSASQGDSRTRQAAGSVTNPSNPDTDGDGLPDGIEDANRNGWTDGDGKTLPLTATRTQYATARPNAGDWPNGIIDSFETWTETSPVKADSDGDGLVDGYGEDKNANGLINGDTDLDRVYDAGEAWTETDPLKADTDGDGLPDGWEVQYGLDPLDNGTDSMRSADPNDGNPQMGASGDLDNDGLTNAQELAANTNPTQITVVSSGGGEGTIRIGTFTDWTHNDLLALDEYNEGGSQGADVYRTNNYDNSRDIVAFSFRDGGAVASGGDGKVYFRVDLVDLAANAEQGEVDAYVVIDTGNTAVGERALPDSVDIATDMRWEVVVAAYGQNSGAVLVDTNRSNNTTTDVQTPNEAFGVERRGITANGLNAVAWSSKYDAVEIAVQRQALLDAGWLGDPSTLNFQVFTTRDGTQNSPVGPGDIGGRNDIRDTIGDDWLASDYWKDQDNIRLNGKLTSFFGRSSNNDRGKAAKVMLLAHGNHSILPASAIQTLVHNGASSGAAGYFRMLQTHENYHAPLTLHVTPTLASALQWAVNPAPGATNDGPSLNARIAALVSGGNATILGSTYADHIPKYFPQAFNHANKLLADKFLDSIYGAGNATASRQAFWAPERVLDDETLAQIAAMGYTHTFADQTRHLVKWFGRTSALGTDGFRLNEVNGVKIFPIHDTTSEYLDQTLDEGASQPVRELLSRRARSSVQDQVVVLWRDMADFADNAKSSSYDANVRWLASRPWIRVVTAGDIINGSVAYKGQDGNTYTTWGTVARGSGLNLIQTAKDWIDHATQENYDNWYNGSANEQGLAGRNFGATTPFGQVGSSGHANTVWQTLAGTTFFSSLADLAGSVFHAAMFQTAFHNTSNNDLSKFSTGAYIYPDSDSNQTLADFAKYAQSQARYAVVYSRVQQWANSATSSTLAAEAADIDLDGSNEYLLYNSRVFALFEAKGGRMTAAWMRDPFTGRLWQVAGNFASYSGTDTEDEGASNFVGATTILSAYRTSGFKDWWTVNTSNAGSNSGVNSVYTVAPAPDGTGWTFTSGGISKTIRIPAAASEKIRATYTLTGLNKAYIRFGLSPNLLALMLQGQSGLSAEAATATRASITNTRGGDVVRAWVEAPQINAAATDVAASGFTTVLRRNQAQTHQLEAELTGAGPHTLTLGFDLGTDLPENDTDGDTLPDDWETANFGNLNANPTGDADNDGLTNHVEYRIGSNPNNAASGRSATLAGTPVSGFDITFPTLSGLTYQVQFSNSLTPTDWQPLGSPVPGDGNNQTVTDSGTLPGRRFYRVLVTSP